MKRHKQFKLLLLMCSAVVLFLAGCGDKSQESVEKKIESTLQDLEGYKVAAEMTMNTGKEARNYLVDIWYKKDEEDHYRVGLENEEEEDGQVILKNKEGVFVLTPALKKSFKFQTDWPGNSSQPYLYQSLVHDVLADEEATFSATDNHYVFETKTNYQNNNNLPYQEVYFDKKTYAPTAVKVLDKEKNVLIDLAFTHLDANPSFTKEDFDREMILEDALADDSVESVDGPIDLAVTFPLETVGAELVEKEEVKMEDGKRIIMTFKGDRNFTLIQQKKDVQANEDVVEEVQGDVVTLGTGIGAMSDNALEWTEQGVDYYLASEDMTMEELVEVASSMEGQEMK